MTALKVAVITGITGQDGSYLAEILLERGWTVHGVMRRSSVFTTERLDAIWNHERLIMHHGDVVDLAGLAHMLAAIRQQEPAVLHVYNLAAQSHVGVSFETPVYTAQVDALGALNILEAVRTAGLEKVARVYQASTSELYGKVVETPQTELTPFYPRSPYGVAKLYAFWIMKNYRESYGMFVCNGVLNNHESLRRGKTFVTRKITLAVAKITRQRRDATVVTPLRLGNIDSKRDWGHARDYVLGMIAMLEHDVPDDYVLATGETHSVREFVELAFGVVGVRIEWRGSGVDEVGVDAANGEVLVEIDPRHFRPAEVDLLLGDATKAREMLGWRPTVTLPQLVREMVEHDCAAQGVQLPHPVTTDDPDAASTAPAAASRGSGRQVRRRRRKQQATKVCYEWYHNSSLRNTKSA